MNKMFLSAAFVAASLGGAASLGAQSAPAVGSANTGKIGVLNLRQAIVATAEGKQALGELQGQFSARQGELENLNKQINDIRQRLQANGDKLSPEEGARLQRQGEALSKQLQRKQEDYQEDANAAQQEVFERVNRKMMDVLDRFARENAYTTIFDSSAQGQPILYNSNSTDVTAEVVKLYDQAYPAKAAAAAKPPAAATKPGTAATATPKP